MRRNFSAPHGRGHRRAADAYSATKLNLDLFDRRFAVYTATQDYMVACLNRNGGTHDDARAFYEAQRPAPLLFDKETNDFLVELWKQSINLQVFGPLLDKVRTPEQNAEYTATYYQAQQWIATELEGVTIRFQKIINLSKVKLFSINRIVSLEDPAKLQATNANPI